MNLCLSVDCVSMNLCLSVDCQNRSATSVIGDALKWLLNLVSMKIQDYLPDNKPDASPLDEIQVVHGLAKNVEKMLSSHMRGNPNHMRLCENLYKKAQNKLEKMRCAHYHQFKMMAIYEMTFKDFDRFNELKGDTIRTLEKIKEHFTAEKKG